MFAVPGWSVSSSSLKTQTLKPSAAVISPGLEGDDAAASKGRKRKRKSGTESGNGKSKARDVNATNLAELWESVIEGKSKTEQAGSGKQAAKKRKIAREGEEGGKGLPRMEDEDSPALKHGAEKSEPKSGKKRVKSTKEERRNKKATSIDPTDPPSTTSTAPPPPPKPTTNLTPLQASMRQKLISARFRHLNQTLYTTPSTHSLDLFTTNPEMFTEYHEGFRRQVEVWPENPVSSYLSQIKSRGKVHGHPRKGPKTTAMATEGHLDAAAPLPLPRTDGLCRIADLGCGDAGLAQGLQPLLKKLKVRIHSFDLQSPSSLVTKADIADLPLADNSVDVAIFCLALMGTNWIDFIEEAFRVLRWKGELWVAEIKSRFGRVGGPSKRVAHSVGHRVKNGATTPLSSDANKKKKNKASKKAEEQIDDEADLAVAVDGDESRKEETDVSAFVEVLCKRGFILQGPAELGNRMFVKMCFVKAATPVKGKGVPVPKGMAEMGLETWQKKKPKQGRFVDEGEAVEDGRVSSEAAVLKPCVYKLR